MKMQFDWIGHPDEMPKAGERLRVTSVETSPYAGSLYFVRITVETEPEQEHDPLPQEPVPA